MLFSIVTICYNNLQGLKLTYNSVIKQCYANFEWIVVDGDSTDGTCQWLKTLKDKRIIWVSEKDNGIFDAMNKGAEMAAGTYIVYMNSSDEFASDTVLKDISVLISTEQKNEVKFIYGDSLNRQENGVGYYRKAKHHNTLARGMFTQHQAMFFKANKRLIYRAEFKLTADYAYIAEYLYGLRDSQIIYVNKPLCLFKLGGTNEVYRYKALAEDFKIRRQIMGVSLMQSCILYLLHFVHTTLKKWFPGMLKKMNRSILSGKVPQKV